MGEVDGHKYPDLGADEAVEIAEVLVNEFGGEANSEEAFASAIGHSSTSSGAYRAKVADVRKWGILQSRGVEATELAYKLANPKSDSEERKARFEMYENVGILQRLYDHLEAKEPPSEFWRVVSELTGVNPKTAREAADDLQGLYEEMLAIEPESEEPAGRPSSEEDAEVIEKDKTPAPQSNQSEGVFVQIAGDSLSMEEVNDSSLEMARLFIESKKRIHETTLQGTEEGAEDSDENPEQATLAESG